MRWIAGILAALGAFALVLQFRLVLGVNAVAGIGIGETVVRFFSYFTILSNTMAALALLGIALGHRNTFFSHAGVQTAIAAYITVVCIVYFFILSALWTPTGPQWLADVLLHYTMPVLYVLFWFAFVPKDSLRWRDVPYWLIFPLLYVIVVLARGSFANFWPYPFLETGRLGWGAVLLNCAAMLAFFTVVALAYTAIARLLAKRAKNI